MIPALRKSTLALLFFVIGIILMILTAMDAIIQQETSTDLLTKRGKLVNELGLTDLALSTEARYTRHLSMADRHSAFQDHPTSFDHFPSGSIFSPPSQLHD